MKYTREELETQLKLARGNIANRQVSIAQKQKEVESLLRDVDKFEELAAFYSKALEELSK